MRINLAKSRHLKLNRIFLDINSALFANEYDVKVRDAKNYIKSGKQGLEAFSDYLNSLGYKATTFILKPNKDVLRPFYSTGEDEHYDEDGNEIDPHDGEELLADKIETPSFGIFLDDNDEKLIEFKLKYM